MKISGNCMFGLFWSFFPNRKEMVQNNNADLKGKDDAEGSSSYFIKK